MAAQNEAAFSYHTVHGLYFLAVVFAADVIISYYMQLISSNKL